MKIRARSILPWPEQKFQYLPTLGKHNCSQTPRAPTNFPYLQRTFTHYAPFSSLPSNMEAKKTKALQWQHASWHLEKSLSVQLAFPVRWDTTEEFTDWVFVAGMLSFPLPRFSWLDQCTNRRKGAHIAWPCHSKWLWHVHPAPALCF